MNATSVLSGRTVELEPARVLEIVALLFAVEDLLCSIDGNIEPPSAMPGDDLNFVAQELFEAVIGRRAEEDDSQWAANSARVAVQSAASARTAKMLRSMIDEESELVGHLGREWMEARASYYERSGLRVREVGTIDVNFFTGEVMPARVAA